MKKILLFAALVICISCTQPVLEKTEYEIVEIVNTSRNGFNMILGYDVIINYDSAYYFGWIDKDSTLTQMKPRKFEWEPLK
jgi:hypothetical protein